MPRWGEGTGTGSQTPQGSAGSRIDECLQRMENGNESVLWKQSEQTEGEWRDLPDLALIFRPPAEVMDNMSVSIRPSGGPWGGNRQAGGGFQDGKTSWGRLKRALNAGIAFRLVAKNRPERTEAEEAAFKEQLQQEVDQFRNFLQSISRAWEDFMTHEPIHHNENPSRASSSGPSPTPASPGNWVRPKRTPFQVKAIATGICQIYPKLHRDIQVGLIDIETLTALCPCPWPPNPANGPPATCQIVEKVQPTGKKGAAAAAAHASAEGGEAPPVPAQRNSRKDRAVCAFKMRVAGGGDNVTLRIWANGKTQASGCKDRAMLVEANKCIADVIKHIMDLPPTAGHQPLLHAGPPPPDQMQEQVRVLSAPMLGSWDLNLKAAGGKLDMSRLCEYLSGPKFAYKVVKVQHVAAKGNSARFNNISLYIRKECLKLWSQENNEQQTVYVNVYEAGKCSVLAVPDLNVAEELADVVSDMLFDAFEQDGIGIAVQPQPAGGGKRKRSAKVPPAKGV
uniref:Uncharacterized protein n=1 Tax=Hemiselmis andersenii TaxID=464988 RepID=A0A7S0Y0T7_HEMAN